MEKKEVRTNKANTDTTDFNWWMQYADKIADNIAALRKASGGQVANLDLSRPQQMAEGV